MPAPNREINDAFNRELEGKREYDDQKLDLVIQTNVLLLNPQQKEVYDTLMKAIDDGNGGEEVLIPRIPMIPTDMPFEFERLQFPICLAFAMTINKSQGQSLKITLGAKLGLIHSLHCDPNKKADVVPGDYVVNAIIAVAWRTAREYSGNGEDAPSDPAPPIYNVVSSVDNPLTWKHSYQNTRRLADSFISKILNLPNVASVKYKLWKDFLNLFLMATKSLKILELSVGELPYLLFHIAPAKLPVKLKTRLKQRYGSHPRVLPIFDQLVEFLEEKCLFLYKIPRDVQKSSGNASRWMTYDQRASDSGRRIKTPPPLRRKAALVLQKWVVRDVYRLRLRSYVDLAELNGMKCLSVRAVWYYVFYLIPNKWLHMFLCFLMHWIPAYIVDGALLLVGKKPIPPIVKLLILRTFHANKAHPQEIADSHIHQGVKSVKATDTTSLSGPLSCNGQKATKASLKQPQTTTNRHACQMLQTNHHQHYPNSYRQASNNGDL
ncbi:Putative fatty acyl-CoA reductase CG5065 [Eumeta japonica]|uniref:Fatty acyl-CoA reductase CG5065 n=1 Tax=Eumeta variegata TaxID=151549 RepID=A0A4C1X923_EUMVA|nr:Putative fatty acyl-CoA reductase CG5065 [Eumeta japonica]